MYNEYEVNRWVKITIHSIFCMAGYNLSYNARQCRSNPREAIVHWKNTHNLTWGISLREYRNLTIVLRGPWYMWSVAFGVSGMYARLKAYSGGSLRYP